MHASQVYPTRSNNNTFTAETGNSTYRYFNGRRFYVDMRLQHFIYPHKPASNWCEHVIYVALSDSSSFRRFRHTRVTRYHNGEGS